jgi:hypothetical protein
MKESQRKAMFANINKNLVNETELDEIVLGVTNDGEFYRRVLNPNAKNIEKRMRRGDFQKNHAMHKKTFIDHLGKEAIKTYEKEYGNPDDPMGINVDTRRAIGQELVERAMQQARENLHYDKITKTDKGRALMKKDDVSTKERQERISQAMRRYYN